MSVSTRPNTDARVGASLAYTGAEFVPSANFVRFAGNTPPNVPTAAGNLWGSYRNIGGAPLEAGATVRIVGDRQANNANSIVLHGYAHADAYVALTLDPCA